MNENKDTYKTVVTATAGALLKDRGSKFYGYAIPVTNESDIIIGKGW